MGAGIGFLAAGTLKFKLLGKSYLDSMFIGVLSILRELWQLLNNLGLLFLQGATTRARALKFSCANGCSSTTQH